MPPEVLEYVAPLIGFFAFGTFSLIALRMWFTYRSHRLGNVPPAEMERLTSAVEDLRTQLDAMRDENAELHERMDFAERVLARGKGTAEGDPKGAIDAPRRES